MAPPAVDGNNIEPAMAIQGFGRLTTVGCPGQMAYAAEDEVRDEMQLLLFFPHPSASPARTRLFGLFRVFRRHPENASHLWQLLGPDHFREPWGYLTFIAFVKNLRDNIGVTFGMSTAWHGCHYFVTNFWLRASELVQLVPFDELTNICLTLTLFP